MKYRLYMMNFGYFLDADFASLEAAQDAARGVGLEVGIVTLGQDDCNVLLGVQSPIGGYRSLEL